MTLNSNYSNYSNKYRKILFEKINNLSTTEHEEIYKMISNYNVEFTQNKNGIFFNISNVDDRLIEEINKFVFYCMGNKTILDEYDKKLNECKINNNFETIIPAQPALNLPSYVESSFKTRDKDWECLGTLDTKKIQSISMFVDKMAVDREKIGKKKLCLWDSFEPNFLQRIESY